MELLLRKVGRLVWCAIAGASLLLFSSCGGDNSSSGTTPTSKFPSRIYVLNSSGTSSSGYPAGYVYIINATNDNVWQVPITVPNNTDLMVESPDKKTMLLGSSQQTIVFRIDNTTEAIATAGTITLPAPTESMAVLSDNNTGVVAARNAPVTNATNGAVLLLDLTNSIITSTIPVPEVETVAVNNAGNKVLAFADNSNSVYVIDTTAKTATPIAGFDRPVAAVFSADDSKAYILNCGPECGGSTASVQVLNTSDNSLGANVPVNGATVGLLSSNKLFVAGTAGNSGLLDVVDISTMTRTQSGIAITDGYHTHMGLAEGGKLYVGAKNCSVLNGTGCLSIFNVNGTTAVIPETRAPGKVTGIQPIAGRGLVYVTIGGELIIFETATDAPRPDRQLDVVGNAAGVKLVD